MFYRGTAHSEASSSNAFCPRCSARWSEGLRRRPGLCTKHKKPKASHLPVGNADANTRGYCEGLGDHAKFEKGVMDPGSEPAGVRERTGSPGFARLMKSPKPHVPPSRLR